MSVAEGSTVSQPPFDQPAGRHPGYGPTPPTTPPAAPYPPQSPPAGQHPGYGANTPPAAPRNPGARNPLGLASLILGAVGPVLGFVFVFVQAGVLVSGGPGAMGPVSAVQAVLVGLSSLAAVILGLVVVVRPGAPKALASAGLALGAAGLLGVLGGLLYPVVISAVYA